MNKVSGELDGAFILLQGMQSVIYHSNLGIHCFINTGYSNSVIQVVLYTALQIQGMQTMGSAA